MTAIQTGTIRTKIPSRMDRLPWSRWHWLVVVGLGSVWILDGLEVTIVGNVSSTLTEPGSGLSITAAEIGAAASIYIVGACLGALLFGWMTDRFGRKKLFMITLAIYMTATALTGFSFNVWWFFIFRFLTGMGIGGEYAAINSAIDELIPARVRGRVDLIINGSYWLGAMVGSASSLILLDPTYLPTDVGWRVCFFIGFILAVGVLLVRRHVPESPRWMFIHGREKDAEALVGGIEREVEDETGEPLEDVPDDEAIIVRQRRTIGFGTIARTAVRVYPKRSILSFSLFVGQAFLYNAIFFTYGLILTTFFGVSAATVGLFYLPFAAGNFLGPLLLGRYFDTIGRKKMIAGTYILAGVLLAITAFAFVGGGLNAATQTIAFVVIFFFASAGASAAYLTASEIFPMETRALAIAFFYAVGTAAGGISGPLYFGRLVGTGSPGAVFEGLIVGAALMIAAGVVEIFLGVNAEQQSLEDIAKPLTAEEAETQQREGGAAEGFGVPVGRTAEGTSATGVRAGWAQPAQRSSYPPEGPQVEREISIIEGALARAGGVASRDDLHRRVRGQRWGPGRFQSALRAAVRQGRVRRIGRRGFELGPHADAHGGGRTGGGGSGALRDDVTGGSQDRQGTE